MLQLRNDCFINFKTDKISKTDCFVDLAPKNGSKKIIELHADFMSGWAMARLELLTVDTFGGYSKEIFGEGEYLYDANDHHGTPRERLNSMANGFWFGKTGSVLGFDAGEYLERGEIKFSNTPLGAFAVGQAVLAARKL